MDAVMSAAPDGERAGGGSQLPALPPEAPLAMPEQSLWAPATGRGRPPTSPRGILGRRALVLAVTLALTAASAYEMYQVLKIGGLTPLEATILALYVMLFAWIAFSFASVAIGFVALLAGGVRTLGIDTNAATEAPPQPATRSALLVPTYNEEPVRLMARIEAIDQSIAAAGGRAAFDLFILSDTTDPEILIAEEAHVLALRERTGGHGRIFYRHRRRNEGRKAGNVAEWVRRFGAAYEQMIVLDADSLMTGDTILRLVGAMERHPRVGLIQTLPVIIHGRTLFARAQQFAGRIYGPLIAEGIAWWHGAEGNYWGHNAVIRVRAFADAAGLPTLRGRKPFGGHILSHDFVEAALMRRGGWAIHMAPGLGGSYEEAPPSLTDAAVRDRRWCQGNLQHIGVLPARGLHWVSRLHLATGIGSYITAPLWLLFLLVGIVISLQAQFIRPEYFPSGFALFPQWPEQDPVRAAWVFAGTMGLLIVPKLFGYLLLLRDGALRRGCGGGLRAFVSLVLETFVSGLIAPVMMLMQSAAVAEILIGRDAGWKVQRRDDGTLPSGELLRRYGWHTAFGVALGVAAYAVSVPLFLWMSPVILGLVLAIPLAALTASPGIGRALRRLGLLLIPEEREPPDVIVRAAALGRELARTLGAGPGIAGLFASPTLLQAHRAMLPPRPPARRGEVDVDLVVGLARVEAAENFATALAALSPRETMALLCDARGVDRLAALWRAGQEQAA
jgi:membrane glycosyltransferase